MQSWATRSLTRSAATRARCEAACSRRNSTRTRCPTRSARSSRQGTELQRRRECDEPGERGRDGDGCHGAGPGPAVHRAHPDEEEPHTPRDDAEIDRAEHRVAAAVVVAARAAQILAVQGDSQRPEGEERERERCCGESDHLARAAPPALAAEAARGPVEEPTP